MVIFKVVVAVLLVISTIGLCGLILIQRAKGGGLAGAFGGGGVEQAFGTRATTLAQKATAVLAGIYLLLSILLGLYGFGMAHGGNDVATPPSRSASENPPAHSVPPTH